MMPSTYEEENAERGKKANKCILKFNARWAKKQKRGRNIYTEVKKNIPEVQMYKEKVMFKKSHVGKGEEGMVLFVGSCCTLYAR